MSTGGFTDDQSLLASLRQGNRTAFDRLFRKYYPVLCTYGHRFVSLQEAEEIVQDLMLWLWENREVFVIESSLSQYLFRAVYHRSLNQLIQQQVKLKADTRFYEQMQKLAHETDLYHIREMTLKIEQAISNLPPTYREAFEMHRFRNMSYKEIATVLEISPKTVDYRIQQALKQLRSDLREYLPIILPLLLP
ncbi:MAG: RNA polymerase sigma-70 factor [Bacteroides sp.]|nr:RNA polymerase sigma-70 factor [Bacteroides sp.]